jgi:DICT domain-containing protein
LGLGRLLSGPAFVKQEFQIDLGKMHKEYAVRDPAEGLTIGELARRTGVPAATLRSWETRYGFPRPHRVAAGHRRYALGDVKLVEKVLRQRTAGLTLPAAITQATVGDPAVEQSVFAVLRRHYPELQAQILRKSTLLALTRAIEDEYCARAEHAILFASFQERRFFSQSEARWNELARTARTVVIFAGFDRPHSSASSVGAGSQPRLVPVPATALLRREWVLVCQARDYPVCLSGWEIAGQSRTADADRQFEVLWTLDPRPVRDAALTCARLAESYGLAPSLIRSLSAEPAPPVSPDLQRATGLLTRMASYLDHYPG